MADAIDVGLLARRIPVQYPFTLIDGVIEHDREAGRLVATKNVTGAEEYFQGHFPAAPIMPGVLQMEGLAQAAGIFVLSSVPDPECHEVHLVGLDQTKFRKPVVPGDTLRLEVELLHRRKSLWRFRGDVRCGEQRIAEARLLLQVATVPSPQIDPTARVDPAAVLAAGVKVGAYSVIGPEVEIGAGSVVLNHVTIQGPTRIGRSNHFFPYASVGQPPQDLKFRGEVTRLEIGDGNVFREFVTIHRGTGPGGGVTRIGSHNLFMAYTHVAHDCRVGDHCILSNAATLGGHVEVQDFATLGGLVGVHQFCRIGAHAFIGGASVLTKDALPYSKVVGNRALLYGANGPGLLRRGISRESIRALQRAFKTLMRSGLNISDAVARIEAEGSLTPETTALIEFIRSSKRGVISRMRSRPGADDTLGDDDE